MRKVIDKYSRDYWAFTNSGDPYLGQFLSTEDACIRLKKRIALERSKRLNKHWSYDLDREIGLRQRYLIARYFRRFGQRIWLEKAA